MYIKSNKAVYFKILNDTSFYINNLIMTQILLESLLLIYSKTKIQFLLFRLSADILLIWILTDQNNTRIMSSRVSMEMLEN